MMFRKRRKETQVANDKVSHAIEQLKMGQGELRRRIELLEKEAGIYRRAS